MIILINSILTLLVFIYCFIKNSYLKKSFRILLLTILTLDVIVFLALRNINAGFDTPNYVNAFNNITSFITSYEDASTVFGNKEPLFWYLSGILKIFFNFSSHLWIFFITIFSFFLDYIIYKLFAKKIKLDTFIPFILLFFTYFFISLGNVMRQMLALPFLFLAIIFYEDKKIFYFLLFSLIAIGIHFSTLIILFYPFYRLFRINFLLLLLIDVLFLFFHNILIKYLFALFNFTPLYEKWVFYQNNYISPYGPIFKRPTVIVTIITYPYLKKIWVFIMKIGLNFFYIFIILFYLLYPIQNFSIFINFVKPYYLILLLIIYFYFIFFLKKVIEIII